MEKTSIPCKIECFQDDNEYGLTKAKVYIMHEGINRKKTSFSYESMDKAKESLKNKPLLAYIEVDEEGNAIDFKGHEMKLKVDDRGARFYYLEKPIGVFPETCNQRFEEIDGVQHLVADCYIWNDYSNEALDLFEESGNEKQVSMEIIVNNMEESDGIIDVKDFTFKGVTVLGDTVTQGMNGTCGIEIVYDADTIENFTEEITSKIKKLENKKGSEQGMNKELFGLGMDEVRRLALEELREYKYHDEYWDEDSARYNVIDIDLEQKSLIVYDFEERTIKGITFNLEDEKLVLDMENMRKFVSVWKAVEGEETTNMNFDALTDTTRYREKIDSLSGELTEISKAKEDLEFTLEKERAEKESLLTYKAEKEQEERLSALQTEVENITKEFDFKADEIKEFSDKVFSEEMTLEDFKKELYALEGMKALKAKKNVKYSKDNDDNLEISFGRNAQNDKEEEKLERQRQAYGGLLKNLV